MKSFMTINKKRKSLQKSVFQRNEGEGDRQCLSAPRSSVLGGKGSVLMQSEDEWEVAGTSSVDKLFCPGMEPGYWIQKFPRRGALACMTLFPWNLVIKTQDKAENMCASG